jgi:hypothetical protein
MIQRHFSVRTDIPAPIAIVWTVMTDVERWPEWTSSVTRVKQLSRSPLQVGSRVRIHQPQLPPAFWQVTELIPGANFTWVSRSPGVRVTAQHTAEAIAIGTRVTLSIDYKGLFGVLLAWWVGELNDRYLEIEVNGLKARCSDLAVRQ